MRLKAQLRRPDVRLKAQDVGIRVEVLVDGATSFLGPVDEQPGKYIGVYDEPDKAVEDALVFLHAALDARRHAKADATF